jgi:hypothetical protein
MQKQHGFARSAADGAVKTAISAATTRVSTTWTRSARQRARHGSIRRAEAAYDAAGPSRSNVRCGYVAGPIDHSVFA